MGVDFSKQGISEFAVFKQTAEFEDRCFVGDVVIGENESGKITQSGNVVEGFFHVRIGVAKPVLDQLDARHHAQGHGWASAFHARLGVIRFNDGHQPFEWDNLFHCRKKAFFLGCIAL